MNPETSVIHFHCQTCGILLTVPAEMAGVSGPCPNCGATITSPAASEPPAPQHNPFAPPLQPMGALPQAPLPPAVVSPLLVTAPPPASLPPAVVSPLLTAAPPATLSPLLSTAPPAQVEPAPILTRAPASAMAGATWPPTAAPASNPSAHPVMERLLHTQPALTSTGPSASPSAAPSALPSAVPAYQQRSGTPPKKRVSSSRQKGKRGAMVVAVLMALLVLAGISWFFRDQLRATWLSYTLKEDDTHLDGAPTSAPAPTSVSPKQGDGEATGFDPKTPVSSSLKAIPVKQPTPSVPASATQKQPATASTTPPAPPPGFPPAVTILPALPANSTVLPSASPPPSASTPSDAHSSKKSSQPPVPPLVDPPSSTPLPTGSLVEVSVPTAAGPPVNVVPSPPPVLPVVSGVTPETQPALDALQSFFRAKTWQERFPFVQAPKSMKPLMEQYYSGNPDGPLYASHIQMIRYDKSPETGPPLCVFQVNGGGLKQPLPIMVDVTDQGWRVDWLTFTEFKDELLLKFLEAPQAEPARFHVLMRRAHYFGDDVPALDKKTCVQIMPPMPGFTGDVFAIKGTNVSHDLDKFLGWDVNQAPAVVELQWHKENNYKWVELTNLVQLNWRNVETPSADKEATSTPSSKKSGDTLVPPKARAVP